MIVFTITLLWLASGLHTDLMELDSVQETRRQLQSTSKFTMLMVGDPQYTSSHCKSDSYVGTANYARTSKSWCEDNGPWDSSWHRTNNYMNAVEDALFKKPLNNRLPAGANIIGDLTEYGEENEKFDYEAKIHDIQAQGHVRVWQSLGNHDTVNHLRPKDDLWESGEGSYNNRNMRDMIQKMKNLLPQWHDKGLGSKNFHDGVYHYDTRSNSFLYRKNGIMFINLQLHPAMHHIDYWCKSCHDHAGHYHGGKWKQVWFSPIDWFKDRVQEIQNNWNGMGPVKGIVLMYHYDRTTAKTCNGGDVVDSGRWTEIRQIMKKHNADGHPPFIAVFNGHMHKRCGYKIDNDLKDMTRKSYGNPNKDIPRFYVGSADYNCFLTVEFYPADESFVVYANAFDTSSSGTGASQKSAGFRRRCVHKDGRNGSGCTKWKFDGRRYQI